MNQTLYKGYDYSINTEDRAALTKWSVDVQIHEELYEDAVSASTRFNHRWLKPVLNLPPTSITVSRSSEPPLNAMNLPSITSVRGLIFFGSCLLIFCGAVLIIHLAYKSFSPAVGLLAGAAIVILFYESWLLGKRISTKPRS